MNDSQEAVADIEDSRTREQRLRHFTVILIGQIVSMFGSSLTAFALGVWAYQQAGSITLYSLIFFADSFMTAIAAPVAGTYVDRWDKKKILLFASIGSALISACIAILYYLEHLQVWQIICVAGLNGTLVAFSRPTIIAAIKILLHPDDLARANGMAASGMGLSTLLAPVSAGFLLVKFKLLGILLIDLFTFSVGIITLAFLKLPIKKLAPEEPLLDSLKFSLEYLKQKSALLWLIGFYFFLNLITAGVIVLIQPLILTFTDPSGLGTIMSTGGFGYLFGAIVMAAWGGPERKIFAIYAACFFIAAGMLIVPLFTDVLSISIGAFLLAAGIPISMACNKTILQRKVSSTYIGRVDGMGYLLISLSIPLGYISAGPIAEAFFEPFMASPTSANQIFANLYGTGTGRGIALMIGTMSILLMIIVVAAMIAPKIRRIEIDLPDED